MNTVRAPVGYAMNLGIAAPGEQRRAPAGAVRQGDLAL
jgi:hypothetical protein